MYNNNIELLKLVQLSQYDIDYNSTTIYVDVSTNEINIHLYLNISFRDCPYCKSNHSHMHARISKRIYHSVLPQKNCIIIFHQIKCPECGHYFMQFNPLVSGQKTFL